MKKSRRHFIGLGVRSLLSAPLILSCNSGFVQNAYRDKQSLGALKGRVVIARDPAYTRFGGNASPLMQKGMQTLLGANSLREAWKRLFRPEDVVSIKVNTLAGKAMSPSYALVREIIKGLNLAGVSDKRIIVWDRSSRELSGAGYPVNTKGSGVRIFGTDALKQGYDAAISYAQTVGSCFARILSQYCTAVVNVGVLKDHDLAGISVLLKNFYGAIHNPNKYHDNNCSPYVAHVNGHEYIRKKLRLNIVDAPMAQYHGGPAYHGSYTWTFGGIILSVDTVAADRIALDIINKKRKEAGKKSLLDEKRYPAYIDVAARMGLGEGNLGSIRRLEV